MKKKSDTFCFTWLWTCRHLFQGLTLALVLFFVVPAVAGDLYDQPPFTPAELNTLIDDLPRFRSWVKANGESAHPALTVSGKPDFLYSPNAATHVEQLGWEPRRFFCVMGRAAAALAIIEQGRELTETPPPDMPQVSAAEMNAVRQNLTGLLRAVAQPVPLSGKGATTVQPEQPENRKPATKPDRSKDAQPSTSAPVRPSLDSPAIPTNKPLSFFFIFKHERFA